METQNTIRALFEFATEGIIICDKDGTIREANPAALKLFNYSREELKGLKVENLVPTRFHPNHQADREKFTENPHNRPMGLGLELFAARKGGDEFPVEISLSHFNSGTEMFVIAFIIDITLRKQAEMKLRTYSQELERQVEKRTMVLREAINELENTKAELHMALKQEKELNDLKSRFISMASHEFRTPLSTILSSASLAGRYTGPEQDDKRQKHISRIKTSVNNLTDILNDFLSLSKLEEGKVGATPTMFKAKDFIEEFESEMNLILKAGQELTILQKFHLPEIFSDRKILKNILINLVSNAIKFSPEEKTIRVTIESTPRQIILSVADEGMGIPAEDQKHLFERFFRGKNATNIQGTGLGLNIVGRYVDLLSGTIDFKSKEKEGTTFTIKLPLSKPPQP